MTSISVVMALGLLLLAVISGMLGLGVAFAAVPFLSLFLSDLVHQVQPLTLLLNGMTALFAALGFARSGYVDWPKAIAMAAVTTISAPIGAAITQHTSQTYVFYVYLAAVALVVYTLFRPIKSGNVGKGNFRTALALAMPITILAGFLGIGPGFLLIPILMMLGFEAKRAAGINALAVTPSSFSALIPHLGTAVWNPVLTLILLGVGVTGAFVGARVSSLYVPGEQFKRLFGIPVVVMTGYKIYTLFV